MLVMSSDGCLLIMMISVANSLQLLLLWDSQAAALMVLVVPNDTCLLAQLATIGHVVGQRIYLLMAMLDCLVLVVVLAKGDFIFILEGSKMLQSLEEVRG